MQTVKRFTLLMLLLTFIASTALEAYYDPHVGRFTQRDPAGEGVNWYAYGANNPMKFVDPTGMYIVLPGGTEIHSVPDQVDGSYVRPRGLTDDGNVVWDSLFTGGINGTGIAGSNAAGGIVTDIIESSTPVTIKFSEEVQGNAEADAIMNPNNGSVTVRINKNKGKPSYPNPHATLMIYLTMHLVHELSHAHDFLNMSQGYIYGQPYNFSFMTELKAFHLEAKYAREMDRVSGNYQAGPYSAGTGFVNHLELLGDKNFNTVSYHRLLGRLAKQAATMTR